MTDPAAQGSSAVRSWLVIARKHDPEPVGHPEVAPTKIEKSAR